MSLVAYEYSDSENENSENEDNNEPDENEGKVEITKVPEITDVENPGLFLKLPTPKHNMQTVLEEDDDEFLRKTALKSELRKPKSIVKITVPSLSDFNDDDSEEVPKKIFKPSTIKSATTGLFSVLPPPKMVIAPTTKFVPNSVGKKLVQTSNVVKPVKNTPVEKNNSNIDVNDAEDDGKQSSNSFFFTSIFDNIPDTKLPSEKLPEKSIVLNVDSARNVQEADLRTNRYFAEMVNASIAQNQIVTEDVVEESAEDKLVKEAYSNLVGKSRKAKGKGNKKQEIEIVDINATDLMPDPREWMTKSLTEEQPVTGTCKKEDEPSLQQRRKHQITYLAYQAKVNEQELKNQWALNKMSRKQTQAKYGF